MTAARVAHQPRALPFDTAGGVYLQSEVAHLTGLDSRAVRRWLARERAAAHLPGAIDQPLASFLELIGLRVVAALRRAGMKPSAIRAGADRIQRECGMTHPLAWERLRSDGVNAYFPDARVLVAAPDGRPMTAQEWVAAYLRDVRYAAFADGYRVATSWEPPGVSVDPSIQRGAPCVAGTRVRIAQLGRYLDAGDAPERLAELFELRADNIRRAVEWYANPTLVT